MREILVDNNITQRTRTEGVHGARGTPADVADIPCARVIFSVCGVGQHHRMTGAVGGCRPRPGIGVMDAEQQRVPLAGLQGSGGTWTRSDVAGAAVPEMKTPGLWRDVQTGQIVQAEWDGRLLQLFASDVPAMGYRTYVPAGENAGPAGLTDVRASANAIEKRRSA